MKVVKRRIIYIFITIFLLLCISNTVLGLSNVTMKSGASIRSTGKQGLRFSATVDDLTDSVDHGFYIVIGEYTIDEIIASINNGTFVIDSKPVVKKSVEGDNKTFNVVVYNIPQSAYQTKISAISYVEYQDSVEYSTDVITRSILDVAYNAYFKGNRDEFVLDIFSFKYSGITYHYNYSYDSLDQLCNELLSDYNLYASTTITKETISSIDGNTLVDFMSESEYSDEWYWFFKMIVDSRLKYEDEIEEYATKDYASYIPNHNKNNYTPFLKRLLNGEDRTGLDTGLKLWVMELDALFNRSVNSYWNAYTLNWNSDYSNDIVNELLNPSYNEVLNNGDDITYTISRENYEFLGWYTANDEKVDIANGVLNLYAKWKCLFDVIYVNDDWNNYQENQEVVVNGFTYAYGVNAFSNINDALASHIDLEIHILPGTYDEDIIISRNNIMLIGPNDKTLSNRSDEAILTGNITINNGVKNLYIGGLSFEGDALIKNLSGSDATEANPVYNLDGFEFSYNVVNSSLKDGTLGFIYFKESKYNYSKDIVITNNIFEKEDTSTIEAYVHLDNLYNLELVNNDFIGSISYGVFIKDTNKGLSGELININYNSFAGITNNALHISWMSPLNSTSSVVNINDNSFNDVSGSCIYLGKYNNTDEYQKISICNNYFETYGIGMYISRCTELGHYSVSNNVFATYPTSYYVKSPNSSTTSPSAVYLVNNLYFNNIGNIVSYNSSYVSGSVENDYLELLDISGSTTMEIGDEITISTNVSNEVLVWSSSNERIATVNGNGEVVALREGNAHIYAKYKNGGILDIGITVYNQDKISELMKLLVDNHHDEIFNQDVDYVHITDTYSYYENNVNGSSNNYWAGSLPEITEMLLPNDRANYSDISISSLEYIVFHDTGGGTTNKTAKAIGNWCIAADNTESSWHYTIGNDGIYQHLPDKIVGWHAGDGKVATSLTNTGIKASSNIRYRPTVTIGDDGYYYIDGVKSQAKSSSGTNSATLINQLGLACVIKNGYYYIPNTWTSTKYDNALCARGGNYNSIGIESCVNNGSNLWLTWQYSAKLIAQLLVKYNLGPDRVLFHNNFSNKICPYTMINAGLTEEFLDLVYMEYYIAKYYSDYTITFTSSNPKLLDSTGNVVNNPSVKTSVQYTITISNGENIEKITLNTIVLPEA